MKQRTTRGGPAAHKALGHTIPWNALVGSGPPEAHLRVIPTLKNPINRETIRNNPR